MICVSCRDKIRWYQRTGVSSSWHKRCWISWEEGCKTAHKFSEEMNRRFNLPSPSDFYWATQITSPPILAEKIFEKIRSAAY